MWCAADNQNYMCHIICAKEFLDLNTDSAVLDKMSSFHEIGSNFTYKNRKFLKYNWNYLDQLLIPINLMAGTWCESTFSILPIRWLILRRGNPFKDQSSASSSYPQRVHGIRLKPKHQSDEFRCFWEVQLTAHNWQKWKRVFLTCPCHRDEAVGLKSCKFAWKITIFVKLWNLGQYRENLIFCQ